MPEETEPVAHVEVAQRFSMIPEELLHDPTIPAEAVRVYGVLLRYGSDPKNCYPSHAAIASRIGKSPRSVPAWIGVLEKAGWIEKFPTLAPDGGWTSNRYRVHAAPIGRVPERALPVLQRGTLPVPQRIASPLENATKESQMKESNSERERSKRRHAASASVPVASKRSTVVSAAGSFDEFWAVYPLKRGKRVALQEWERALKRATAKTIIAGAKRYADDTRRDPAFTKYPQGWLKADRWDDEPEANRPTVSATTKSLARWAERTR